MCAWLTTSYILPAWPDDDSDVAQAGFDNGVGSEPYFLENDFSKGLPYMTSTHFSDFFDLPSSLVTVTNQLIVFLSSAFWGPLPPSHCGHHISKPPNGM